MHSIRFICSILAWGVGDWRLSWARITNWKPIANRCKGCGAKWGSKRYGVGAGGQACPTMGIGITPICSKGETSVRRTRCAARISPIFGCRPANHIARVPVYHRAQVGMPVRHPNAYRAILDYIHLNPVRAGLVAGKDGLESYAWSSLPLYLKEP